MYSIPLSFVRDQPSAKIKASNEMLFKFKPFEVSGAWEFIDPDTNYKYIAPNKKELIQLIVGYRSQNKLDPIPSLDVVLESYLCTLPCNTGKCKPYGKLTRGLMAYMKGGIALVANLWYDNTVSQKEADRRSSVCFSCPLNVFPDRGPFVQWSDNIAEASIGKKKSEYHDDLGNCAACSCPLRAKVWYPGPVDLNPGEETLMRSVKNCWQLELKK